MKRNKRRHNTGFGYIGSSNNPSIFNQKPKDAFSKIKNQLNTESQKQFKTDYKTKTLSALEKQEIKNKIRKHAKQKNSLVIISTLVLLILIILLSIKMMEGVLFK
ncbi:hypothetical protein [Olleya sp. R77988]|uniref:hypothetical protein n=1 Tax=Olleya sp. R77988 TaxID=3093875 RepID=UPI0037C64AE7